jgi:hypothetical protein
MHPESFRSLITFYTWFKEQPLLKLPIQTNGGTKYDFDGMIIHGMVLCRLPPYQVELFMGYGPGLVPSHRHPHVDSFEVAISGDVRFVVEGKVKLTDSMLAAADDGSMIALGAMVRVRPNAWHGATVGDKGGSFLSIQHWLESVPPTSVAHDWEVPNSGTR